MARVLRQDRKCPAQTGLLPVYHWNPMFVCDWTGREDAFPMVGHGDKGQMLKTLPASDFLVALLSRLSEPSTWACSDISTTTPTWVSSPSLPFAQSAKHKQKKGVHTVLSPQDHLHLLRPAWQLGKNPVPGDQVIARIPRFYPREPCLFPAHTAKPTDRSHVTLSVYIPGGSADRRTRLLGIMEAKDISTNIHETLSSLVKWEERPQLDGLAERNSSPPTPQPHSATPQKAKWQRCNLLGNFPKCDPRISLSVLSGTADWDKQTPAWPCLSPLQNVNLSRGVACWVLVLRCLL